LARKVMKPTRDRTGATASRYGSLLGLLAAGLPLFAYLHTVAPTVYGLDSAELTTGAYVLGIVHAPGSPLFLLLGHLFTWLPFGDVGYRVNLLSVSSAALTAFFVYRICLRLTSDPVLSLSTSWLLAFSYYIWVSAVAAELYALHVCFVAGLAWLGLEWKDERRPWQICLLALLYGLGLGNHLALIVLAPGFLFLVSSGGELRGRTWLVTSAFACGILGACVYLYLPLRASAGTPLDYPGRFGVDVATWQGFWWMISGRMFAKQLFAVSWNELPGELLLYAYRLWSNFFGIGLVLGIFGLVADFNRRRGVHLALLLMFTAHLGFMLTYNVADKDLMLGPTYFIWSLWVAMGVVSMSDWVVAGRSAISARTLLLVLSLFGLCLNYSYADLSNDWSARKRGEAIFNRLPQNAVYIGTWADVPVLEYLQLVEGRRPDVETLNVFFRQRKEMGPLASRYLASGRAVYAAAPALVPDHAMTFVADAACACYQLVAGPDRQLPKSLLD
jgi:hypothetical protein